MRYKILASSLTAHPNNQGTHLDNYLKNKFEIAKNICESLILHDQVLIPILDYFTACGLIKILGEDNFITLLESNQIRFLRTRHQIVFAKARHLSGDIGLSSPKEPHAWSSPNEVSISLGLDVLGSHMKLKNRKVLERLLLQQTNSININDYLDTIRKDTFDTFKHTSTANKPFNDFLGDLPDGHAQITFLGDSPLDINNPIKVVIGLATIYYETYLLNKFNCLCSSSTVDFNNLTGLTSNITSNKTENLWSITELYRIPNLGEVILNQSSSCKKFIKITRSSKALQFREWFHNNENLNTKEIQQEFIGLTEKEPWFKSTLSANLCWGVALVAGIFIGPLAGIPLDIGNKLLGFVKGKSPKYFISDLRKLELDK